MRAARSKALAPNWPTFAPPQWPNFTPPLTSSRHSIPPSERGHRTDTKKAIKKHEKQHSDNGRHLAKGHDKHHHAKGDKLTRYVVIEQPHRHGLTRYNRYVQDDGYVYAVDPQTNDVLALIGLASRLLN